MEHIPMLSIVEVIYGDHAGLQGAVVDIVEGANKNVVAYGIESGGAFNEKGVIKSSEVLWFHFTNVKVIQKHEDLS